jgi:hypothetical protein
MCPFANKLRDLHYQTTLNQKMVISAPMGFYIANFLVVR